MVADWPTLTSKEKSNQMIFLFFFVMGVKSGQRRSRTSEGNCEGMSVTVTELTTTMGERKGRANSRDPYLAVCSACTY